MCTQITSLNGYVQVLQRSLAFKGEPAALKMKDQTDRLSYIVEDLLDVTRLDNDQFASRNSSFDLGELIALSGQGIKNGLRSPSCCSGDCWELILIADRERIGQVITNILSNAKAYSGAGRSIEIGAYVSRENVVCRISDKGNGIEKSKHK